MGGAPSRETLVRHIVRDPRVGSGGASSTGDASANLSQQPEIVLIPLIPDYFPSSASPLFQQLVHVRREPTVSYYYRDARSTFTEHTVVHNHISSDKELYNWYMSLSEQRLMETDNELIALSRAGRVVSPVPCAVAFVCNAQVTAAAAAAAAATANTSAASTASPPDGTVGLSSSSRKKDSAKSRQHRRGKQGDSGVSNGYMTIENTVRVPHHTLRVRIFGFVGDTRFCPPSMHPNHAAKSPMCLTIFLSKSTGGNHRTQVTLLAAHTYMTQLQEIGILHHADKRLLRPLGTAASSIDSGNVDVRCTETSLSPVPLAAVSTADMDPLAGLRGGSAGAQTHFAKANSCSDPYTDPYSAEEHTDPYGVDGYEGQHQQQQQPIARSSPSGGSNVPFEGLGSTSPSPAMEVASEVILRRPIEVIVHRADVPALCYVRELRARMDQDARTAVDSPGTASVPAAASTAIIADRLHDNEEEVKGRVDEVAPTRGGKRKGSRSRNAHPNNAAMRNADGTSTRRGDSASHLLGGVLVGDDDAPHSLKRLIHTVIKEEELHGSIDAESMGRVLLWASRVYLAHIEQLVGGEAAKLRQELAQRNLRENPLDGTLLLSEDEPRPPKTLPVPGDVWITPHDTYVEVHAHMDSNHGGEVGDDTARSSDRHLLRHAAENWKMVSAGTVLRYVADGARTQVPGGNAAATAEETAAAAATSRGAWLVSTGEYAEDILLSLCRSACHASRRAPPTDEHWLLNRETTLPEGLTAGLLIWREPAAGQVVYYGTTPEFLKQWVLSGVDVEAAYRNQIKKVHGSGDDIVGGGKHAAAAISTQEEEGDVSRSVGDGAQAALMRHSTSIAVTSSSDAAAANTTAASRGLQGSCDGKSPANRSGVSSGPHGGSSGKERAKGSGSSSMALYSVHTGFVCTPDEEAAKPMSSSSTGALSPAGNGTAATAVDLSAKDAAQTSTPRAGSHHLSSSVGRYDEARLSHSLPAYQRSTFAVPVASSRSLVRTPSSAASSMSSPSHSYNSLSNVGQPLSLTGESPNLRTAHQQEHPAMVNLANACWIGLPDTTSRDGANTPTVNVVVKQRRSVRLTPGTSLLDNATAPCHPALRSAPTQGSTNSQSSSYVSSLTRGDALSSAYATTTTQPIAERCFTSGTAAAGVGKSAQVARGSLPIHIFGSRDSSSEDRSFRQGGHSPSTQEQSRSLLRGDDALISPATATRTDPLTRPPPRQSAAMDICPGQGRHHVGTPVESSPLTWATRSSAQPSSMRGASVTFASGSARHSSLLHTSHYQEPCQPVLSLPGSFSTSELLASSASSAGSFPRKKEALRPPPLMSEAAMLAVDGRAVEETSAHVSTPVPNALGTNAGSRRSASGAQANRSLIFTPPVAAAKSDYAPMEARRSGSSSAPHTPRHDNMSDSEKSSVGSGKYPWDWRGIPWNS
ncbi:hypothetical protein ABB37_01637 [Leptomonas pyrrhocoris]|uniref:Uncharacterized protein n=1 Tax=Leptomonas pyrrhocoris TaxID=157538 RepID=A0A0N0VH84_LEPPY|nr:hypothetical protein ABB37_01637 [Leptomonas pyrrhocoris]XP_015663741.1 hypothetical protein ABB37_01637 [Leptomonas pyrrhocoris]KPA85301.1 hypothetical protein ABB37_01637 [Leptomonas pyrrhocoris]KPA85302.1 hypothetical protein ABB37_01637 [Leptomonas pyrrhocoris]|eukprot:XP_015663740.1 hypothetical protein ABB37_01637 [Leptomonas pyrrhocoris]